MQSAKFIFDKFMVGSSRNNEVDSDVNVWSEDGYCDTNALTKGTLNEILKPSTICELHQQLVSKNQNLFKKVVTEIHEFLKTDPFRQFQQSMYYHRYLQWVWLERRPVNENNFFCYHPRLDKRQQKFKILNELCQKR